MWGSMSDKKSFAYHDLIQFGDMSESTLYIFIVTYFYLYSYRSKTLIIQNNTNMTYSGLRHSSITPCA